MTQRSIEIWSRYQNDPNAIPDPVLYSRLADTIAWCSRIIAGKTASAKMRSPEISPRLLHSGRDDAVCEVGSSRHWQVRGTTTTPANSMPSLNGGRLLCYFPDADLSDGAAEQESGGFFDAHNTPPWDTWVGYFHDGLEPDGSYDKYLLVFVPEQLVSLATAGILVNPEECIVWFGDANVKLRSRFPRL